MHTPTPGGPLADVATALADPLLHMVAHLAKAPRFGSLDGLVVADLTECNFAGYAPVPIVPTLEDPIDDPDFGLMDAFRAQWIAGAVSGEQAVTALYVTASYNGSAPVLRAIAFFDPAVLITTAGQVIERDINCEGLLSPG